MRLVLQSVRSDFSGFASIIDLAAKTRQCLFEDIEIDMRPAVWFDANMCAPLGAVLYRVGRELNNVELTNICPGVETILSKNAFLSSYGAQKRRDTYGTTIEYQRFETKDDRYFGAYVETNLVGKGIPKMSAGLQKKFRESIFEIFSNAVLHSRTELGIFACGQYFPNAKRLDFSIADLGVGIRRNVLGTGLNMSAEQAIIWAMEGMNTTKTGSIPGGLGLKLLREFILRNNGRIQIASDRGYWELRNGKVSTRTFPAPFPGTVVNIEINTADSGSYYLASETSLGDIF